MSDILLTLLLTIFESKFLKCSQHKEKENLIALYRTTVKKKGKRVIYDVVKVNCLFSYCPLKLTGFKLRNIFFDAQIGPFSSATVI